jgi:hypothetical protein
MWAATHELIHHNYRAFCQMPLLMEETVVLKCLAQVLTIHLQFDSIHPEQCLQQTNRHFYRRVELQTTSAAIVDKCDNNF